MNQDDFITLVALHLSCYDMSVVFHHAVKVPLDNRGYVSGYFDDYSKKLHVARNSPIWLSVLVHEYCHFLQWENDVSVWKKFEKNYKHWETWVDKRKNLSEKQLNKEFLAVRNLELDCEKRAVKIIKKYKLPINVKDYIKNANSYIYFYSYVKKFRTWCKLAPYKVQQILDVMPTKFLTNAQYNRVPSQYCDLVNKHCI